jgi:3-phosphoshikimate 1-carboxyvinyltransferase
VHVVGGGPEAWRAPAAALDAGNSGSTLRMMMGALAGRPFRSVLSGDESLRRRPMERVAAPLRAMGARIGTTDGRPPVTVDGGGLRGTRHALPVASAQVKTALLLAGLQAEGDTEVTEPVPSRDHTERLLPEFGVALRRDGAAVTVQGGARLRGATVAVPGDPSSAAFLVVAALVVPGGHVRVEGVLLNPTRLGFVDVLRRMGADVAVRVERESPEPVGSIEARAARLGAARVGAEEVPALIDELPVLAVAGACGEGLNVVGAAELRVKESDRIAAIAEGLTRLGAEVEQFPDGFRVRGGRPLRGAVVDAHGDHRIAMAMAVAGLAAQGETTVSGSEAIAVSFPEFPALLEALRR